MPKPNENTQPNPRSDAEALNDTVRTAPHLVFIRQLERLDEAMAEDRDPMPAFLAWKSGVLAWARKDPIFLREARELREKLRERRRTKGPLARVVYVARWRTPYIDVMRRAGMFPRMPSPDAPATSAQCPSPSSPIGAMRRGNS